MKLKYIIIGVLLMSMIIIPVTAQLSRNESISIRNIEDISRELKSLLNDVKTIISQPTLQLFGTEYQVGDAGTTFIQLLDEDSQAINDASCTVDAFFPNKTKFLDSLPLTHQPDSDGLYFRDFTVPNTQGLYMLSSSCFSPAIGFSDTFDDFSKIEASANVTIVNGEIVLLNDTLSMCMGSVNACSTFVSNLSCIAQQGCSFGASADDANITGIIDTFEFETSNGMTPTSIKVNDSAGGIIYAVFYEGLQSDGFVSTYEILNNGTIVPSLIDTFEFDTTQGVTPSAIRYSDGIYLVGYRGPGGDGFAETINITDNGTIIGTLDSFEIDETDLREPNVFFINEDNGLIGFSSSQTTTDGVLGSGNVSGNGTINRISRFVFNDTQANFVDSINVSGNVVLVAFQADVGGDNFGGHLQTIFVLDNGTINNTIDSEVFDIIDGDTPSITRLNNDLYTITYKGVGGTGRIATYNVFTNGTISSKLHNVTYDGSGFFPNTIAITDEILGIVHQDGSGGGEFLLMSIASNGTISLPPLSNITFTDVVTRSELLHFKDGIFIITFDGDGGDGFITTVNVTTSGGANVCSGTATPCSSFNLSESSCTNQLSCVFTPQQNITAGFIQSIPVTLDGNSWDNFSSIFLLNSGTLNFSILDNDNSSLCDSLGDLSVCANTQTPIKLFAQLNRIAGDVSPTIDSWKVIWLINGTQREIKGAGELHVSNIAEDVWNFNDTINSNILLQFARAIWEFTGTISSVIGDFFGIAIWTSPDRTLTDFNFTIDVSNVSLGANITQEIIDGVECVVKEIIKGDDGEWIIDISPC